MAFQPQQAGAPMPDRSPSHARLCEGRVPAEAPGSDGFLHSLLLKACCSWSAVGRQAGRAPTRSAPTARSTRTPFFFHPFLFFFSRVSTIQLQTPGSFPQRSLRAPVTPSCQRGCGNTSIFLLRLEDAALLFTLGAHRLVKASPLTMRQEFLASVVSDSPKHARFHMGGGREPGLVSHTHTPTGTSAKLRRNGQSLLQASLPSRDPQTKTRVLRVAKGASDGTARQGQTGGFPFYCAWQTQGT